jgi:phage shock protein PspC (stress-responsive transcriptional regulator)
VNLVSSRGKQLHNNNVDDSSSASSNFHHESNFNQWTKSPNGWIGGVCQGISESIGIEAWVIRALWIASVMFFGTGVLLYFLFWFSLPNRNERPEPRILGVCHRISIRNGIDLGMLRVLFSSLIFVSLGSAILFYLILAALVPRPEEFRT